MTCCRNCFWWQHRSMTADRVCCCTASRWHGFHTLGAFCCAEGKVK